MISIKEKELLIKEIIALTDTDLMYLKELDSDVDYDWKYFVAYRIRAMIMKRTLEHNQRTAMFAGKEQAERFEMLNGYVSTLYDVDYIRNVIDWDAIFVDHDYRSVAENKEDVIRVFGYEGFIEFLELVVEFDFMNKNSETFKNLYNDFSYDMLPLFRKALSRALDSTDFTLSNREIATYVNKVVAHKYYDLKLESDGKIRVKHGDKYYYPVAKFNEEQDAWMLFMNRTFSYIGVEPLEDVLTKKQFEFLKSAYEISQSHYENRDKDFFRWNHKGRMIVNKNCLAKEIGVSEPNYTQTMKRINQRIDIVWADLLKAGLKKIA
ncbi:hypothetical protein [Lactococcus garvieae]|uniref:hypothetical protein n=1 Tax=Lactococcus garvieae TaxID=1363 RepID=UPI0018D6372D|nr:hypothetical protein [Lactococcus garvieae]QPS71412.1 hypothetical protein I6G50_01755 [Lactococcus garvieae]